MDSDGKKFGRGNIETISVAHLINSVI